PECNHLLVYGADMELAQCADDPQSLIDAANSANGLTFLAHPNDQTIKFKDLCAIPWADWRVERYTGLEIWNYMSSFKNLLARRRDIPAAIFRPEELMMGPDAATLTLWDDLLTQGKRVVGIGNSDAHGTVFRIGPFSHTIFPYDFLFNCVNTHVL